MNRLAVTNRYCGVLAKYCLEVKSFSAEHFGHLRETQSPALFISNDSLKLALYSTPSSSFDYLASELLSAASWAS